MSLLVVVKRRSRCRGPVKFAAATACPIAPRGKPGLKPADGTGVAPEDGTGVKFAAATAKRISLGQVTQVTKTSNNPLILEEK